MGRYRTLESLTDVVCLLLWDNERIYSVRDYYSDVVIHYNPSQFRVSTSESRMMTCPFHKDDTPSMGVLIGRDGFERFTCFGCKTFGHVVDMHQRFQKDYLGRVISRDAVLLLMWKLSRREPSLLVLMRFWILTPVRYSHRGFRRARVRYRFLQIFLSCVRVYLRPRRFRCGICSRR